MATCGPLFSFWDRNTQAVDAYKSLVAAILLSEPALPRPSVAGPKLAASTSDGFATIVELDGPRSAPFARVAM
jgi:hypothetical protein